jgi:N-acetylmuramoyl-L-alanine amidase
MSNYRSRTNRQALKKGQTGYRQHRLFSVTIVLLIGIGLLLGLNLNSRRVVVVPTKPLPTATTAPQLPTAEIAYGPTVAAAGPNPLPHTARFEGLVGLVSGHKGYDPGTVCDDGLTEAEVNAVIAREVSSLLERRGIQTDLLAEFDAQLTGYQADALVSIHADSCQAVGASGFKVARITDSAIPEAEDMLVACLNQEYAAYTGLPLHPSSITDGMTNYHAFSEIDQNTPGAIIETGFLLADRELLEKKPKIVARGIAAGIICFLESAVPTTAIE